MNFQKIGVFEENIFDQETFDNSTYAGIDRLLGVNWSDCAFVVSADDEEICEAYYLLESNGEVKGQLDDTMLIEMDGILFAAVNTSGEYAIAVDKRNINTAIELLTE